MGPDSGRPNAALPKAHAAPGKDSAVMTPGDGADSGAVWAWAGLSWCVFKKTLAGVLSEMNETCPGFEKDHSRFAIDLPLTQRA